MRFLPSLRRSPQRAALAAQAEKAAVYSEYYQALWQYENLRRARPWPIERAVSEGYERIVWVFKGVNAIGSDSAGLPYKLRQGGEIVEDDPLCRVLNGKANPLESGQVFRKRLSAQIILSKAGAFVEVTKSRSGNILEVHLLPPDRTELIPGRGSDLIDHVRLTRRDGSTRRIDWDKVRWFRDPHPLDPYSGITPLEAAGMSVELDYFARLYNVSFVRNDGRPAGVLGVANPDGSTTDVDPAEMDRLEAKFEKGPRAAGSLAVVTGDIKYVDLAAKPRDMAYSMTSQNSRTELLAVLGVPETALAQASGKTFANADAELYVYWTRTVSDHNDIIVDGFDEDSDDDVTGFFDTSRVEVLERAERERRAEARTEVEAGLRSIKSYADLAGYGDQIEDTPMTRALFMAQGRTPIPSRQVDAAALGLGEPATEPPAVTGGEDVAATTPREPSPDEAPVTGTRQTPGTPPGALTAAGTTGPPPGPPGAAAQALAAASVAAKALPPGRPVMRLVRTKQADDDMEAVSGPDLRAQDRLEDALAAALAALATRWAGRTAARLRSPRVRRGTRHWQANGPDTRVGTKALDTAYVADGDTWASEASAVVEPIIAPAAVAAAGKVLADLGGDESAADRLAGVVVRGMVAWVALSAARQAVWFAGVLNGMDQAGQSVGDMVAAVRESTRLPSWAQGAAASVAAGTVNGARDAAALDVVADGRSVDAQWFSRRDSSVRETHGRPDGADGQTQPVGQPFLVGGALLRFPADPLGPPGETINCRCFLRYRARRTGRWVRRPVAV